MLDLGNLLDKVAIDNPELSVLIQKITNFTNGLARNVANSGNGNFPTPPPIEALSVKASDGLVHVSLTHNAPIQKGINYFVEHSTDPNFAQPHVVHLGAARGTVLNLPAMNDAGTPTPHYFRAYAQYPGSKANDPVYFGGNTPTPVSVGGTAQLTLLPSTGSGTASSNGQQGGQGLGTFLLRAPLAKQATLTSVAGSPAAPPVVVVGQVDTPTFSVIAGTYTSAQTVSLACSTVGASIYYTTDGSIPTTTSTMYTVPISISTTETIIAIAAAAGLIISAVASSIYVINIPPPVVSTPTFSPAAGTYTTVQSVSISSSTVGSTIHYTLDGSTPSPSTTQYVGAISVGTTQTINAIAVDSGMTNSAIASSLYTINLPVVVATPVFSVPTGTYTVIQSVFIDCSTTGSSIYYTLDGSTPPPGSTLYTGVISVGTTETVKALAVAAGYTNSIIASSLYTINLPPPVTVATPTFSPFAGTYTVTQSISVACSTASSTIYYTLDGSTPTTGSTVYSAPISVAVTDTIKAIATAAGMTNSAVGSSAYIISPLVATPTFNVVAGTYTTTQSVSVSTSTSGASIYYTADGSTPTTGSSLYSGPISVSTTETLKAIATKAGMTNSAVASNAYVISPLVNTPTFSPVAGTYAGSQSVSLSCSTVGATIYYTLDGSTPTTSSTLYSSPISVASTETINAIAVKTGMTNSFVGSSLYTITVTSGSLAGTIKAGITPNWQDLFNTGSLNAQWTPSTGYTSPNYAGQGSNITWSSSQIDMTQGCLRLALVQPTASTGTCAEITTTSGGPNSNGTFGYGTFEVYMRAGSTSSTVGGTGSAISGSISASFIINDPPPSYASITEIDCPEIEGITSRNTQAEFTAYINGGAGHQPSPPYGTVANNWNTFHYYGFVWSPGLIKFYVDGVLIGNLTTGVPTAPASWDINFWSTNSTGFGGLATTGTTRYMYVQSAKYWA